MSTCPFFLSRGDALRSVTCPRTMSHEQVALRTRKEHYSPLVSLALYRTNNVLSSLNLQEAPYSRLVLPIQKETAYMFQ